MSLRLRTWGLAGNSDTAITATVRLVNGSDRQGPVAEEDSDPIVAAAKAVVKAYREAYGVTFDQVLVTYHGRSDTRANAVHVLLVHMGNNFVGDATDRSIINAAAQAALQALERFEATIDTEEVFEE